jgi:hypothetical protein
MIGGLHIFNFLTSSDLNENTTDILPMMRESDLYLRKGLKKTK